MPIATWPVNRLLPSSPVSRDRPSLDFDNTKVVYDTSTRVHSHLVQLLYPHHSKLHYPTSGSSAFDLIAQDQPVKGKPHKAVWPVCLNIPAERPIPKIFLRVSTRNKCRGRFQKIMRLSSQLQFCCSSILLKLYPEATQDTLLWLTSVPMKSNNLLS